MTPGLCVNTRLGILIDLQPQWTEQNKSPFNRSLSSNCLHKRLAQLWLHRSLSHAHTHTHARSRTHEKKKLTFSCNLKYANILRYRNNVRPLHKGFVIFIVIGLLVTLWKFWGRFGGGGGNFWAISQQWVVTPCDLWSVSEPDFQLAWKKSFALESFGKGLVEG